MPIDPSIALGVKPLQLADPLAQYAQIAQIQGFQHQNQVAQSRATPDAHAVFGRARFGGHTKAQPGARPKANGRFGPDAV
jgi:hypothetical protein